MSENAGCVWMLFILMLPFILFGGDPDLMDAIIKWLMK